MGAKIYHPHCMAQLSEASKEEGTLSIQGDHLCVVSPEELSEACFSVPAVRSLKRFRPEAKLSILCSESIAPLWETLKELDEVVSYPERASVGGIVKALEGQKSELDSVLLWHDGNAAKAMVKMGVRQRFGYPLPGLMKKLTESVKVLVPAGPIVHRVRYYLNLVEELGADVMVRENFQTDPLPSPPETPTIAVSPASACGESHDWLIDRFKDVAKMLSDKQADVKWLVIRDGARSENACAELESYLADIDALAEIKTSEWGVKEKLEELPKCSALLACDGELPHLAAHVGLPTAVIFGPNEPQWRRPLGKQNQILRQHVACSPCFLTKCTLDIRCQSEVSSDLVFEKLQVAIAAR